MSKHPKPADLAPSGAFSAPPPNAPKQVSQPIANPSSAEIDAKRALATEHALSKAHGDVEYQLPAGIDLLNRPTSQSVDPDPGASFPPAAPVASAPATPIPEGSLPPDPDPHTEPIDRWGEGVPPQGEAPGVPSLSDLEAEFRALHPAASTTDSPSRGVPKPSTDPGKQITGGFGIPGSMGSEYFGLDGLEVQQVAKKLWSDLSSAMERDLRLGIAAVYPQIRIRLTLQIDGIPGAPINEAGFDLHKVAGVELIRATAQAQDDPSTPSGALRADAGLLQPGKRIVKAGATTIMVDVPAEVL